MRTIRAVATEIAVTLALTTTLFGCSRGGPTAAPTVAPATVSPATPTPIITAAATAAAGAPIPDGTYQSGANMVSDVLAMITKDTRLTASQKADYQQGFSGHTSDVVRLDLHAGVFTESDSMDGAGFQVGARATYAFPDARTLVIQEDCCGLSTFTITPQPNGFSLTYKTGAPNAGEDVIGEWLYGSHPFTLVP
jgi:hypothetical protein